MKRAVFYAAAALSLFGSLAGQANAQAFTENFDDVSLLAGNGWYIQNNSNPLGPNAWFQGTPTTATPDPGPFNAYNGAVNAYIAANFASTTGGSGTISNWLVTPNRIFRNGDVLTFFTRKNTVVGGGTDYPDRLQVRLSTNGASTNVGPNATALGDFTTLLLELNPALVAGVYPQTWTMYTIVIAGLPAPTSGRVGFRYFVTNGGPSGSNSDYIGVDNVVYTPYVFPAFTMPSGGALTGGSWGQAYSTALTQTGALGAPNFAVTSGALPPGLTLAANGTITGFPTTLGTFPFTVTVNDASGCSGSQSYSIQVTPTAASLPLNVSAVAGNAEATVSWDAPASDGGSPVIDYTITVQPGGGTWTAPSSPFVVTGLTNGTPYTFTVTANTAAGPGAPSTASTAVMPLAPVPAAIPTLSEWALMGLSAILAMLGTAVMRRKKRT
jgi:hypothetical protein